MNNKKQIDLNNALTTFLSHGGVIEKCKPKLAPKKNRNHTKTVFTKGQMKYVLGYTSSKIGGV